MLLGLVYFRLSKKIIVVTCISHYDLNKQHQQCLIIMCIRPEVTLNG